MRWSYLPNDYFVRNVNTKLREFTVSDIVVITTATRWAPNDGPAVPWWITRAGTEVHSIEEQYIP